MVGAASSKNAKHNNDIKLAGTLDKRIVLNDINCCRARNFGSGIKCKTCIYTNRCFPGGLLRKIKNTFK